MDTDELIRRAERELSEGDRSARKTVERARRELLKKRDTQGLEQLLDLARRLDDGGDLTYAIQQNLLLLSRQSQGKPHRPYGVVDFLAGCLGAFAGGVAGVALTFLLLSGAGADAFEWLAAFMFFGFIGAALGSLLGIGVRRFANRSTKLS